jgi:hypothetical protein
MIAPGLIYIGAQLRFTVQFTDSDGNAVDPASVVFRVMSPWGSETTLTYGVDADLQRLSTGSYTADFSPGEAGRHAYRWQSTGTGTIAANEGTFSVQSSPFFDQSNWDYGWCRW